MSQSKKLSIIAFSGDLDKLMAVFIIATGAAASGMQVGIFTTFWGTSLLRKIKSKTKKKSFIEKIFAALLPKGPHQVRLSRLNMFGIGSWSMKYLMKKKNIANLEKLMQAAEDLGVKINVCEMSMNMMGFQREEMIDYKDLSYYGIAGFLNQARDGMVLFI